MTKANNRIYLSSPHMSGREQKYIKQAFDQNWIAPLGPNVDAFETEIAKYCGVKCAAGLNSGTAAMHLALILLGVGTGDVVIAPTFTFSATINPILYQGASPIFIDSEYDTWNMDPVLLERALYECKAQSVKHNKDMPKAIIVAHIYGMPAKMIEIMEIANRFSIPVIEDAAEALGSTYMGKHVGTFGKIAILSFNGNKIITTSGGGSLISDDVALIDKARFLSTQARDMAPHYQHSEVGYNYRMSNILAGIGRGQMEVIDERVKQRRAINEFYRVNIENQNGISFLKEPGDDFLSNFWLTTMLINSEKAGVSREEIQDRLDNENIESRPLWKPMHLQPVFKCYKSFLNGVSENLFKQGLCLPSGSNIPNNELARVVSLITNILKE